jgi:hypothetical protein
VKLLQAEVLKAIDGEVVHFYGFRKMKLRVFQYQSYQVFISESTISPNQTFLFLFSHTAFATRLNDFS